MNNTNEQNPPRGMGMPGFLLGLGAGVVLTMLLAPTSGAATRRFINRKVRNGRDWMQDKAEFVSDTAEQLHDRAEQVAKCTGLA